jgi:hypothetical protein
MVCQPEELKLWQTLYQAIKQDMRSQIFYEWIKETENRIFKTNLGKIATSPFLLLGVELFYDCLSRAN